MSGEFLNLARILERTRAEGPGLRFCIWTQGCLRNCPGCCNAAMQPLEPRMLVPTGELVSLVLAGAEASGLEGVTFLGGEPLLQAKGLAAVARAARGAGLTVMVFTGFTLAECRADPLPGVPELLAETDVLVDGPYRAECPEPARNWVGSSNQRFHYLTGAYGPAIETDPAFRGRVEFRVDGDTLRMNGCPRTLPERFSLERAFSRDQGNRQGARNLSRARLVRCPLRKTEFSVSGLPKTGGVAVFRRFRGARPRDFAFVCGPFPPATQSSVADAP